MATDSAADATHGPTTDVTAPQPSEADSLEQPDADSAEHAEADSAEHAEAELAEHAEAEPPQPADAAAAQPTGPDHVGPDPAGPDPAQTAPPRQTGGRPDRRRHIAVLASYLAITLGLLNHLWRHLPQGRLAVSGVDQYMLEWYLWYGQHAVLHGHNPLFTTLWNPPDGASIIGNTSVLGLGLPLAPVTLLFGPQVTLAVALTLGLAGSAAAWYWLLRRLVPGSTLGAALGGGFCAFAPAMVSHANGAHLNLVVTGLIPFIIWHALRLRDRKRALRNGVPLGLLVVYQFFIGEELIMLTFLGLALFCVGYAVLRPRAAWAALPNMVKGLAMAVAVALPLLAYPAWFQLAGPQSYSGVQGASSTTNDIFSMFTLPSQSFIGDPASTAPFVNYHDEENAFFGIPLLLLIAFGIWRLRRELIAQLAAGIILLAGLLSLGNAIHLDGRRLAPGPWQLVQKVPVLNAMIVSRLTFLAIPFIGLMITLMVVRSMGAPTSQQTAESLRVRRFALLAIVVALVSVAPTPLPVVDRPPIPSFITSGVWRQTISPGSTLMTVPMTMSNGGLDTVNWQIPADGQFSLVGGYFLGPHGADRLGRSFPSNTPTQRMINNLWLTGTAPTITETVRAQARTDLAALRVDDIVVAERGHSTEVVAILTQLLGLPPAHISDVWTWKISNGVAVRTAG